MLWIFLANGDGSGGPPRDDFGELQRMLRSELGSTAGEPAVADVDGDGTLDLIATFRFSDVFEKQPGAWIVFGISGPSGRRLWSYSIEKPAVAALADRKDQPAVLVRGPRSTMVACVDGSEWIGLDPTTGNPISGPIDLGGNPVVPVQHADLDGDGEPEILALGPGPIGKKRTLQAFSIKSGHAIWSVTVDAAYVAREIGAPPRDRPLIADLDEDGRAEILVADSGRITPRATYRGVRLIDGRTGETQWRRPMGRQSIEEDGLAEAVIAPDLDGDGVRKVVAVRCARRGIDRSFMSTHCRERTGILSGGGRPTREEAQRNRRACLVGTWTRRLAAPRAAAGRGEPRRVYNLVVSEPLARPSPLARSVDRAGAAHGDRTGESEFADLDGDGQADLWGAVDGELRAFRGEAPETWRAWPVSPQVRPVPRRKQSPRAKWILTATELLIR